MKRITDKMLKVERKRAKAKQKQIDKIKHDLLLIMKRINKGNKK